MSKNKNPFEESVLSSLEEEKQEGVTEDLSIGRKTNNIFLRSRPKKIATTYYLEEDIVNFFTELSNLLNLSSSSMVNDLLKHSIINNSDLKELANASSEARRLLREFIESVN